MPNNIVMKYLLSLHLKSLEFFDLHFILGKTSSNLDFKCQYSIFYVSLKSAQEETIKSNQNRVYQVNPSKGPKEAQKLVLLLVLGHLHPHISQLELVNSSVQLFDLCFTVSVFTFIWAFLLGYTEPFTSFGLFLPLYFSSFCLFYFIFQAQPISPELTAKLLGNRVAVSPIVTIEPRRRKFHKPITLTIPVPVAAGKGMINQYQGDTPTLRLLCSITGETSHQMTQRMCTMARK